MASSIKPNRRGGPHLQRLRGHVIGGLDMAQIMNFVKNAVSELKRGKYISKGADMYSQTPLPYSGIVGAVGKLAGQAGFGKRKVGRPRKTISGAVSRPRTKRPVGRPRKSCGGAVSLAQRRGLVPIPTMGTGKKLAQRRVVPVKGKVFGKGLSIAGGSLSIAGNGLKIAGGSKVSRRTVFP